jgi:hypothetical protein
MKRFAIIVLAAVLIQPTLSVAQSTGTRPKPSSFVPNPHSNNHVYGAPIQTAIVGHSRTSHHKPTPKKPAAKPKK